MITFRFRPMLGSIIGRLCSLLAAFGRSVDGPAVTEVAGFRLLSNDKLFRFGALPPTLDISKLLPPKLDDSAAAAPSARDPPALDAPCPLPLLVPIIMIISELLVALFRFEVDAGSVARLDSPP